jgi:hypothetical protein
LGSSAGTAAAGDDARITGAQQRSTMTTKGDLYVATGSATVTRQPVSGNNGWVLTEDSAQLTGVKWATAAGGTAVKIVKVGPITSGNITVTTALTQIGTDVTITATTGDILDLLIAALCNNTASVDLQFEAATIVSGTATNYWSSGTGTSLNPGGIPTWYVAGGRFDSPHGNARYTVQAGDVVSGQVTVRVYAFADSSSRSVFASASYPLALWLTNYGAGT